MAFLNPFFLFGLLAAGIPLLIHLWNRRRVVTIDFSSLMFLAAAHRENARRLQLRQLLILLLRMAIVALIAIALARPFLTLGLPVASMRSKTDVVIVLDNSYSMGYQEVDGVRFEKAKAVATDILNTLRHGDSATLILMSDTPYPVFQQLTPDLESVIEAINTAKISYQTTHVQSSLELAHEILAASQQLNKELYLISDFARNGWENWERLPNRSGARISLIPVTDNEAHNISIEEIRPSNQLMGVNLLIQLNVTIVNHSTAASDQNILTLFIGGEKQKTVNASFDRADETLKTTLTHTFSTPGTHTGYLTLTEDRLNIDNRRYFALDVIGEVRVLCVGEETDYLTLALNPHNFVSSHHQSAASSQGYTLVDQEVSVDTSVPLKTKSLKPITNTMILPTQCTPAEFENFPLEGYDVIILADVPEITRQSDTQLQEFIRQGKSIIVFMSSQSAPTSYNALRNMWLPAEVGPPLTWTPPQQVGTYQKSHPIFDIFPSAGFSTQYAPQFYNGVALQPTAESKVIARFEDDTPFLVERIQGTSAVLLYNCGLSMHYRSSATTEHTNDLLVNPYFLPMLQQSVLYTVMASGNFLTWGGHVGDTYTAYYPRSAGGKASIRLMDVSGQREQFVVDQTFPTARRSTDSGQPTTDSQNTVVPIDEDGRLRFQGTERPGIYQIEVETHGRIQRDFFAVNVDGNESDLAQISLQQAAARVGARTTVSEKTEASTMATDPIDARRHGREIWGELLILAICLMMLESFLSNRASALVVGEKQ